MTRADVARAANSSAATVSYVINNGPKSVLPETRDRILRAIDALGYRPNMLARSLRTSSTHTIGMMVPAIENPFFAELVAEIEQHATKLGKVVLFGSTGYDTEQERHIVQSFDDRRVDAILGIGLTREMRGTAKSQGALIVMKRTAPTSTTSIGINQRAAAKAATQHLLDHGYRSVGCITGSFTHPVFNTRYRGWRDTVNAANAEIHQGLVRRGEFSLRGGYQAARELFTSEEARPRAVFVSNDIQTVGVLRALHELELRVPEDVAVISIDGTELSRYLVPGLSTIQQPTSQLAREALLAVDRDSTQANVHINVPFTLLPRESCGCSSPPGTDLSLPGEQ